MMKLKTTTLDDLGIYLPARNRLSQLQTEFPENIPSIGSPSQGKVNLQKSIGENILVQNLLTDFLCFQAGTDFYLPSNLPETFYNSFYHLLHLARLADDGKNQKLRYSTPVSYTHLDVYKRQGLFLSTNNKKPVAARNTQKQVFML